MSPDPPDAKLADDAVPVAILGLLAVTSVLGFHGIFQEWSFLGAALLGVFGATAVSVLSRWTNLVFGEGLLVSFAAFGLIGPVASGGFDIVGGAGSFVDGLRGGWAELLSTTPPADLTAEMRVLPFALAWFGAMLGGELLRGSRVSGLAAAGPISGLVIAMLLTFDSRPLAIAQGAVMVVGTVTLGWFQQRRRGSSQNTIVIGATSRTSGLVAAALAVAIVAVAAPVVGPRLPNAESTERFDLRRYQDPRFDPLHFPSPLAQLKASLTADSRDLVVFTARTEGPLIDRFAIATLPTYNGVNWLAADERLDVDGEFVLVGSRFPPPLDVAPLGREEVSVEIAIRDYGDLGRGSVANIWLPTAGWPLRISDNSDVQLMFSRRSGSIAVPSGVPDGLVYEMDVAVPFDLATSAMDGAAFGRSPGTTGDQLVGSMSAYAADVFGGVDAGTDQVLAVRNALQAGAYTAEAGAREARPGHSARRLDAFLGSETGLLGFEEQYAAAAALLLRSQDIPARVVVGYRIPEDELSDRWSGGEVEIRGGDLSAWVEVLFDEFGWMPFDVTPPRIEAPEQQPAGLEERAVAAPNPPPEPDIPDPPPRFDDSDLLETVVDDPPMPPPPPGGSGVPVGRILVWTLPPVLLIAPVAVVILAKLLRRRRRRTAVVPSRRVAGAWQEVLDRFREGGYRVQDHATPREHAHAIAARDLLDVDGTPALWGLVADVEVASGHRRPPDAASSDLAWDRAEIVLRNLRSRAGVWKRIRTTIDPRPLLRPDLLKDTSPDE